MQQFLQNVRARLGRLSPRQRRIGTIVGIFVLAFMLALVLWPSGDGAIEVDPADTQHNEVTHVVQSGEYLIAIAKEHQVPWQAVATRNQTDLDQLANERCEKLSERYRNRTNGGHYCAEQLVYQGRKMYGLNSLQPGDKVIIPLTSHPVVDSVMQSIPGQSIAIVVDDTGSMGNDISEVSAWYMRATGQFGKDIATVVLYADGFTREYESTGQVQFRTTGSVETTRAALEQAAASNPDAIVLVSDEPGDDWKGFRGLDLPPVYSHSLEEESHDNLRKVSRKTGGEFMRPPLHAVIASR